MGTAQMAGTEIMRISDLNTMEVQVEVSENDILKVALGDTVDIEVDAYIDRKFKGIVTEIANSAANIRSGNSQTLNTDQVTNFIVKIRMDQNSYQDLIKSGIQYPFRPGMSASVDIVTNTKNDIISVPIQAVTMRAPKDSDKKEKDFKEVVFLWSKGDTAQMIYVKTGIQDDEYIEIKEGLKGGEKIVSGPYSILSKKVNSGTVLRKREKQKEKKK